MKIRKGIIVTMSREIEYELREHKCSECKRPVYTTPQWVYKTRDKLGYIRYQCGYSLRKNCKYKEDLRT